MVDYPALFLHSLLYGGLLSLFLGILIWVSIYINPEMWLNDYPPDVRAKFGPMGDRAKWQRKVLSALFFPILVGILILSLIQLPRVTGGSLSFLPVFLSLFIILMVFNLVDLLIIDGLIGILIQPGFMILPGTEGMAGYRDFGFHFRGFLIGIAGLGFLSLVGSGITVLAARLLGQGIG